MFSLANNIPRNQLTPFRRRVLDALESIHVTRRYMNTRAYQPVNLTSHNIPHQQRLLSASHEELDVPELTSSLKFTSSRDIYFSFFQERLG